MAWQIKIHTLNVGQGDAQIIEVWDQVENNKVNEKEFAAWTLWRKGTKICGGMDQEFNINNADHLKLFAQEYKEWKDTYSLKEQILPKYQAILIDGGPSTSFVNLFIDYCKSNKIYVTKILLTHFDEDHYAGLFGVINQINNLIAYKNYEKSTQFIKNHGGTFNPELLNVYTNNYVLKLEKYDYGRGRNAKTHDIEIPRSTLDSNRLLEELDKIKKVFSDIAEKIQSSETLKDPDLTNKLISDYNNCIKFKVEQPDLLKKLEECVDQDNLEIYFTSSAEFHDIKDPLKTKFFNNFYFMANGGINVDYSSVIIKNIKYRINTDRIKKIDPTNKDKGKIGLGSEILWGYKNNIFVKKDIFLTYTSIPPLLYIVAAGKNFHKLDSAMLQSGQTETNMASIGLLFLHKYKDAQGKDSLFSYLTCGDLEDDGIQNCESQFAKYLAEEWGYKNLDLMKLSHHGAKASSKLNVLNALTPKNVIISCGLYSQFQHPTREVIHRLYQCNSIENIYLTNCDPKYGVKKSWDIPSFDELDKNFKSLLSECKKKCADNKTKNESEKVKCTKKMNESDKVREEHFKNRIKEIDDEILISTNIESALTEIEKNPDDNDNLLMLKVFKYILMTDNMEKHDLHWLSSQLGKDKELLRYINSDKNLFYRISIDADDKFNFTGDIVKDKTEIVGSKIFFPDSNQTQISNNNIIDGIVVDNEKVILFKHLIDNFAKISTKISNRKQKQIKIKKLLKDKNKSKTVYLKNSTNEIVDLFPTAIDINKLVRIDSNFSYGDNEDEWLWDIFDNVKIDISILEIECIQDKAIVGNESSSYRAIGRAILYKKGIGLKLKLNNSSLVPLWEVSLADDKAKLLNHSISVRQLVTLADGDFMPYEIPPSLTDIFENVTEGLTLNRFDGTFYANPDFPSKLNIDVSIDKKWTLIEDKLVIENVGFDLELEPDSITGGIYGNLNIAGKDVELYIGMDTEATWALSINGKTNEDGTHQALPNLAEIGGLFIDGFDNVSIPFIADKDPSNSRLEITLIQMKVNFQSNNKIRELALNSSISIRLLTFEILLHIYPEWKIKGYLDNACKPSIGAVLSSFELGNIECLNTIEIRQASVELVPESHFYEISLALGDVADFTIGGKHVELTQTSITIRNYAEHLSGTFAATLMVERSDNPKCGCNDTDYIEDTVFEIEGRYEDTWQFKGTLCGHISLSILINWLQDTLNVTLPQWVRNLHLKTASVAFSTAGNYRFDLALYSRLDDDSTDEWKKLEINLHIDRKKDKPFELLATVNMAGQLFKAALESGRESTEIKFEWTDQQDGDEVTINNILYELGLQDALHLPEALDVGFNNAAVTFETVENNKSLEITAGKKDEYEFSLTATRWKQTWTYAFLLDIKKVSLHFNSLPLVGAELPEHIGVNDISLFVLSGDVEELDGRYPAFIPKILQPADQTDPVRKGGYLGMELDLGNGNKYPVQVSTATKRQKTTKENDDETFLLQGQPADEEKILKVTWKKIGKKVGPLQFNRVGFAFQNSALNLYFDADLIMGPLTLAMDELQLASPVTTFDPEVSLKGIGISYNNDTVQIGGSFKREGENSYSGSALIGTKAFQLQAIGAYAKKDDAASMFIYGMLHKDMGGPSQFYIQGIAAGYGYNRELRLPGITAVKEYPFITPFIGGKKDGKPTLHENTTISQASEVLKDFVKPMKGEQWFAAGVKFSTYNILDSVALLSLKLGAKTEITLVGFSTINYPKNAETPLLYAELALLANILPDDGAAAVDAQLTDKSYLFSKDCKLTGGFAFHLWFGNNTNSGDFVMTMGGYHPAFKVPDHYPQVPRLGFNWPVSLELCIKGSMYFALTPGCIMAGGRFEANFSSGNFRAWFIIGADFMIAWKPYHYSAEMYVIFGVSYTFRLNLLFKTVTKTISVNFGARLQVWGPEFSGTAYIDLSVVSFTINFGHAERNNKKEITWSEFKNSFLPPSAPDHNADSGNNYCSAKAISGMKTSAKSEAMRLLHENVVFEISTVIPTTETDLISGSDYEKAIGVKPVGISGKDFITTLKIEITQGTEKVDPNKFIFRKKLNHVAGALWSSGGDRAMVKNALMGLYMEPKPAAPAAEVIFNSSAVQPEQVVINIPSVLQTADLVAIDKETEQMFMNKTWM